MFSIQKRLAHRFSAASLVAFLLFVSIDGTALARVQDPKDSKDSKDSKEAGAPQRDDQPDPSYLVKPAATARERVAVETYLKTTLDDYWMSKKGLEQAAAMSNEADWQTAADPRLRYAYGVLLLKNNKYDEALKQFSSLEGTYLPAMRARIWLAVLREKYESALADLPVLIRTVQKASAAKKPSSDPESVEQATGLVEIYVSWSGELFGFITGPGTAKVSTAKKKPIADLCKTTAAEIEQLLDERQRKLFDAGKQDALDAYSEMTGVQQTAREEGIEKQKKEQAEAKERLDETKSKLDTEKKQIEAKSASTDQQLRGDLATIDSQLASIEQRKKPLEARGRQLMQQINALDQEINGLNMRRAQAIAAKDTAAAERFKITIDQRTTDRMTRQTEYNQAQGQVDDLTRQAAPLNAKRQALTQQQDKNAGNAAKDAKNVDKRAQMVQRGQRDASKGVSGQTGKAKSMAQAATALRTYVDLDLDRERTQLLQSLEPTGGSR